MSMVELEGVGVEDGKYFVDCVPRGRDASGAAASARQAAPGIAWLKPPST